MTATPITDWLADVDLEADVAFDAEPIDLDAGELDALKRADWHLRHIAAIDRQVEQLQAIYDAELARLEQRLEERLTTLLRARVWHEAPCLALHEALLARQPKRKTINLTAGSLKATVGKVYSVGYVDEPAFVEWAKVEAPALVPPKYAPDKNTVKKAFTAREVTCPTCAGRGFVATDIGDSDEPCPTCGSKGDVPRWVTVAGEVVPGIVPVPPATTYRVDVAT